MAPDRSRPRLAWVRYGQPITDEELTSVLGRYRAAILQPWETEAARRLKEADPSITVLAYQCLSSVREYEEGPVFTSGLSAREAEDHHTYAHRLDGERIYWDGYPGHALQQVWNHDYQERWTANVVERFTDSPFDGIMADNDVFDDYYGIRAPIHGAELEDIIKGADELVQRAGKALQDIGKIVVPNIAESRRQHGRWSRHSHFGGGFEECWMGWGTRPEEHLGLREIMFQAKTLRAPGLTIARTPGTGQPGDPHLLLALAAAWVFAPTADVAVTATEHDGYSAAPWLEQATWDLGRAHDSLRGDRSSGVLSRVFDGGRAAINLSSEPHRLGPWKDRVTLPPWSGWMWRD
jgi:hypothetical protein